MKNRGITLIALVITIIILLILSGVTITQMTSENGLFSKTKQARLENKRSSIKEFLDLKLMEEQLNDNGNNNRKSIIEATRENVIENRKELEKLGKEIEIKEVIEENNEVYFYVIVDKDVYKVTLEGTEYIGKKSEEKVELKEGDIEFIYEPSEWTNGNVKVKIVVKRENINGYKLVYNTEDIADWKYYTEELEVEKNGSIYAKLEGVLGETTVATGTVANIDKIEPKAFVPTVTSTTNSIKIQASTTDKERTEENGMSGIEGYRFSKDGGKTYTEYQESGTYTFNNLDQKTTYDIKVEAKDKAGNTTIGSTNIKTGEVTGIVTGDVTFAYNPNKWTNGNVTVTIAGNTTGYKLQYKTEKTGEIGEVTEWTDYTTAITVTRNQDIYARVVDSTGQSASTYATGTVSIIDKEKPTIGAVTGSTSTANIGTVTATGISDIGGSGISGYYVSTNNTKPTATSVTWITLAGSSFTWNTAVNGNGTYYVWVKDTAGNVSDVKSCTVSGLVSKVTITAYNNLTIVAGNTGTPTLTKTGTPRSIVYSSSNTEVATINASTGVVTGVKAGTATMTVRITNYDGTTVSRTCTVTVQAAVAQVGSVNYASVGNAISAITSSGTVKLLVNRTESPTFPAGKTITFNLNSKTLTGTITNKGILTTTAGTINGGADKGIKNEGTLTVSGTTVSSSGSNAIYNYDSATLTISSGTINGTSDGVGTIVNKNILKINGGTIYSKNKQAVYTYEKGSTTIAGGKIYNESKDYGTCTGAEGCKYIVTGGTIYSKYKNAFNILKSSSLTISGSSTNIYSEQPEGSCVRVYGENNVYGTVTMSNGKITSSQNAIMVSGGKVTITGGTVECTYVEQEAIDIQNNGVVNIQGGIIRNTKGGRAIIVGDTTYGKGTLNVTGGTITTTSTEAKYATIKVNDTYGTFKFTKGTIKNGNSSGYCYYKNKTDNKTGTWTK